VEFVELIELMEFIEARDYRLGIGDTWRLVEIHWRYTRETGD
jgi:hypothetical protein